MRIRSMVLCGLLAGLGATLPGCAAAPTKVANLPPNATPEGRADVPTTAGPPTASSNNWMFPQDKQKTRPETFVKYARLEEQRGNYELARSNYDKALQAQPKNVDAVVGLARLDHLAGYSEDAEKRLLEAAKRDTRSTVPLVALGQLYTEQERYADALTMLNKAATLAPNDKNIKFHLGVTSHKAGQPEQSLAFFKQAVGEAAAHYNMGLLLHERGDFARAEEHVSLALAKNPALTGAQSFFDQVRRDREAQRTQIAGKGGSVGTAARPVAGRGGPPVHVGMSQTAPGGRASTVAAGRGSDPSPRPTSTGGTAHVPQITAAGEAPAPRSHTTVASHVAAHTVNITPGATAGSNSGGVVDDRGGYQPTGAYSGSGAGVMTAGGPHGGGRGSFSPTNNASFGGYHPYDPSGTATGPFAGRPAASRGGPHSGPNSGAPSFLTEQQWEQWENQRLSQ